MSNTQIHVPEPPEDNPLSAMPEIIASKRDGHALTEGQISAFIQAETLGHILIELGGGRRVMTDRIDTSVGLEMMVRLGDRVEVGQVLVRVFADHEAARQILTMLGRAITIGPSPPEIRPLILERIEL